MLAVGYDNNAATPYLYLQNQWGTAWGEEGFVYVSTSTAASPQGVCGVLSDASLDQTRLGGQPASATSTATGRRRPAAGKDCRWRPKRQFCLPDD